jgi:hypothetical protein
MRIFISYRREDSRHITERMYDRLVASFGKTAVFKDVDSIPSGADFRPVLQYAISKCHVLLAVIGEHWLEAQDKAGNRRLDNENDFVRREIEAGLRQGIPVIPVLVDGANIPDAKELPPALRELSFRNARLVRPDPDFHHDMDSLIRACQQIRPHRERATTRTTPPEVHEPRPRTARPVLSICLLILGILGLIPMLFLTVSTWKNYLSDATGFGLSGGGQVGLALGPVGVGACLAAIFLAFRLGKARTS